MSWIRFVMQKIQMNLAVDQNRIGLTAESNLGGRICEQGLYHLPHQVATIGSIKLKISIKNSLRQMCTTGLQPVYLMQIKHKQKWSKTIIVLSHFFVQLNFTIIQAIND